MTKVFRGLAQISSAPDEMEFEKYYMKDEKWFNHKSLVMGTW
jgi:hypothetical protein